MYTKNTRRLHFSIRNPRAGKRLSLDPSPPRRNPMGNNSGGGPMTLREYLQAAGAGLCLWGAVFLGLWALTP